ncbi:hypothetical protein BHYA_0153g00050 [Botrytis hyacinthi]|uniref:2EXR domain-containing protein n=1 Tax=Botrytis hyacinthi TaxID=278943 RepID=A0A4Z1GM63_9HELO|nr:hypothetical protein BHYA_0153g00050 [Botrytis hyacinthi]
MTEISDSELDGSNDNNIGDTSDHEDFDDSNSFDSHQEEEEEEEEEDYGAFQDFDDFSDNQGNNQSFALSPSRQPNVEGLTMGVSNIELAKDGTSLMFFEKFKDLPEEIQMSIWRFSALQVRRTIVMDLRKDTFDFENYPSTPAFMHACQRARECGREHFYAVDAQGVPHDFTDPQQAEEPYFYVNPISDDFILKFGDKTFCPSPTYCPIQFSSEYMQRELRAEERKLYQRDEELERTRNIPGISRVPATIIPAYVVHDPVVHAPVAATQCTHISDWSTMPPQTEYMMPPRLRYMIAAPGVALRDPESPGEPVFPPALVLPHFFDNIRSVGINLSLDYSAPVRFEHMTAEQLQQWAKEEVQDKFDNVFKKILDRFPHLEHVFAVVRAYGRSIQCKSDRGIPRELEKKKWTSVGMEQGKARCMGYEEFKQFENQAKVWLMHERIDRGMQINSIDFGLCVQTSVLWEV